MKILINLTTSSISTEKDSPNDCAKSPVPLSAQSTPHSPQRSHTLEPLTFSATASASASPSVDSVISSAERPSSSARSISHSRDLAVPSVELPSHLTNSASRRSSSSHSLKSASQRPSSSHSIRSTLSPSLPSAEATMEVNLLNLAERVDEQEEALQDEKLSRLLMKEEFRSLASAFKEIRSELDASKRVKSEQAEEIQTLTEKCAKYSATFEDHTSRLQELARTISSISTNPPNDESHSRVDPSKAAPKDRKGRNTNLNTLRDIKRKFDDYVEEQMANEEETDRRRKNFNHQS